MRISVSANDVLLIIKGEIKGLFCPNKYNHAHHVDGKVYKVISVDKENLDVLFHYDCSIKHNGTGHHDFTGESTVDSDGSYTIKSVSDIILHMQLLQFGLEVRTVYFGDHNNFGKMEDVLAPVRKYGLFKDCTLIKGSTYLKNNEEV